MALFLRCCTLNEVRRVCSPDIVQINQVRTAKFSKKWVFRQRMARREIRPNLTHNSYYKVYQHGKSPVTAKSLAQILADENPPLDPRVSYLVDIGLPPNQPIKRSAVTGDRTKLLLKNRSDPELERQARLKTLEISLEEVQKAWGETSMSQEYCETAKHFGVFQDLYGDAYFFPRVPLNINYIQNEEKPIKVCRGNIILPSQTAKPPTVEFTAEPNSLWSLILTNPDGHLTEENSEYVHWFVGNIPGNDLSKGQVIWDHLQPFPPHGTGYQRLVFVLYKQEEKLDFSAFQKKSPCLDLTQRTFNTYEFYRDRQDVLTPAGLCFYQSTWDESVGSFYHHTLGMEEPRYMFDFPEKYYKPQRWFPIREPFDLYLDRYKDPKEINKRYLIKKLAKTHPFEKPPPPLKYPLAHRDVEYVPSWLQMERRRDRLGCGRIRNV